MIISINVIIADQCFAAGTSIIHLSWNTPSAGGAVTGYYLYYGTTNNVDTMTKIDTKSSLTTFDIKGLKCNLKYYVYVKAYNSSGEGPFSDVKQTIETDIKPEKILNLRVVSK